MAAIPQTASAAKPKSQRFVSRLQRDLSKNWDAYLLLVPAILFYVLFCYKPMYGVIIAFKNFSPGKGIVASEWVGLKHFLSFFKSYYFGRLLRNTLTISLSSLIFGFPMPIIFALLLNEVLNTLILNCYSLIFAFPLPLVFALMLNEVRVDWFKKGVQTITYMPHFISLVVMCSLIRLFVADTGIIVQLMAKFGFEPVALLSKKEYFVPIYVLSGIWQGFGWDSIIYLSALTAIDPGLYEAATIDGANRWKQTLHVTLPGIMGTVIILLILRMGSIMSVGYEKIILLYNESIYETSDVISTFVYRMGLGKAQYSYSTAVGLFNSVINFIIVYTFNKISRKVSEVSLW